MAEDHKGVNTICIQMTWALCSDDSDSPLTGVSEQPDTGQHTPQIPLLTHT